MVNNTLSLFAFRRVILWKFFWTRTKRLHIDLEEAGCLHSIDNDHRDSFGNGETVRVARPIGAFLRIPMRHDHRIVASYLVLVRSLFRLRRLHGWIAPSAIRFSAPKEIELVLKHRTWHTVQIAVLQVREALVATVNVASSRTVVRRVVELLPLCPGILQGSKNSQSTFKFLESFSKKFVENF